MFRYLFVLSVVSISLLISGCGNEEVSELAEAQNCLDKATPDTANSCLAKISGYESAQSYMIRCSVRFLSQGFTTKRFVNAFEIISETDGNSSTMAAFAIFKFDDRANMNEALSDCEKSLSSGMIKLSKIADIATFIVTDMGGSSYDNIYDETTGTVDQVALEQLKDDIAADGTSDVALGEKAVQLAEAMCSGTGGTADTDMCDDLDAAIVNAGGDFEQIGADLRALLDS